MNSTLTLTTLLTFVIIGQSTSLLAQGPLTPPGAPAPLFKTLDQVEARTPISSAPFTVSTSGSYYLTGNLAVATGTAITISSDRVTLDLNGFTISSTASPAAGSAVVLTGTRRNVTIRNGHIRGTTTFAGTFTSGGFLDGVSVAANAGTNLRVSELSVSGVGDAGIELGDVETPTLLVERCMVSICGGRGIHAAIVRECGVETAGETGIRAHIVTDSVGDSVGTTVAGIGINALSLAENCRATSIAGNGLQAVNANNCVGISTSNVGLAGVCVHNCQGTSTSGPFGLSVPAVNGIASFCRGRRDGGVALSAFSAIGCSALGTGTISATNKLLGTP